MSDDQNTRPARSGPDICVILNSRSGRKRRAAREMLEGLFEKHPGRFELRILRSGRHIEREVKRAVADGFPVVAAAGGDGTISGVAPFVADAGRTLGVLPFGTFNYFARTLDIPLEIDAAVDVLATGEERRVPMGEVNGEGFINNASLGAYAAILQRREKLYQRWGRSRVAAYWSVLTTLMRIRTSRRMRVECDGAVQEMRTPLAFLATNVHQLEGFGLPGGDCVREGRLALFLAPDRTGPGLMAFAFRLAFRSVEEGRDFTLVCGEEITITTDKPRKLVARDGEKSRMTGPFVFRMLPDRLRVLVPAGSAARDAAAEGAADGVADGAAGGAAGGERDARDAARA